MAWQVFQDLPPPLLRLPLAFQVEAPVAKASRDLGRLFYYCHLARRGTAVGETLPAKTDQINVQSYISIRLPCLGHGN